MACNSNAAPPSGTSDPQPAKPAPKPAPTPTPTPTPTPMPMIGDPSKHAGPELYAGLCAPCHGKQLEGYAADHAPSRVTPTFLESVKDEFLTASIVTGRPGCTSSLLALKKARL